MAIKGSLKEASLPDVLQLLAMGKKTGCLAVTHRNNFGYVYFDKGRICYASIVNRRDRIGDLLGYLAERPVTSVRELIGVVHRMQAVVESSGQPLTLAAARQELEPASAASTAPPATVRQAADVFFLDDEKIVWEWPDVVGRLVEELR